MAKIMYNNFEDGARVIGLETSEPIIPSDVANFFLGYSRLELLRLSGGNYFHLYGSDEIIKDPRVIKFRNLCLRTFSSLENRVVPEAPIVEAPTAFVPSPMNQQDSIWSCPAENQNRPSEDDMLVL